MTRVPKKWPEPTQSEHQLHRSVVQYLECYLRPPVVWTTIDAGAGKMRARTARQRKNRGVKKGWPDILIIAPGPNVVGLELKAEKGELKPEQIAMEAAFFNCKAWYITCRSVDDVEKALLVLQGAEPFGLGRLMRGQVLQNEFRQRYAEPEGQRITRYLHD